jgi:hypothetical protein
MSGEHREHPAYFPKSVLKAAIKDMIHLLKLISEDQDTMMRRPNLERKVKLVIKMYEGMEE